MKIRFWLTPAVVGVIAAGVAILSAGCAGGASRDEASNVAAESQAPSVAPLELNVSVDGWMRPEVVGLLMAEARGYFEDAGLKVWLGVPMYPRFTVPYVINKYDDIGVAQQPEVVVARSKGAPLTILGSVIPHPTDALIWLRSSKIESIADLKGKTIALPGIPYQQKLLKKVLAHEGLTLKDVTLDHVRYELIPALLGRSADAIFGGSENLEGAELRARGAEPVIVGVHSLGIPTYEQLVLVARSDLVAEHPEAVDNFMTAVARGTVAARRDPQAALKVVEEAVEGDIDATRAGTTAQLKATLPLLSPGDPMDLGRAQSLIDWMKEEGMLTKSFPADTLITDESGG